MWANGVTVDPSGQAYVVGFAAQTIRTTSGAFQTTPAAWWNAFVMKVNASGSGLVYSTYLGGNGYDIADAVAVDPTGAAYVAGHAPGGAAVEERKHDNYVLLLGSRCVHH